MDRGALVVGLLLLSGAVGPAQGQQKDDKKVPKDRNVITEQEMANVNVINVLQVIRRLRPAWLTSRGSISMTGMTTKDNTIGVYVDGVRRGEGFPELERIALEQAGEIRYYSVEAAGTKFGSGNPFGAIEVITRK